MTVTAVIVQARMASTRLPGKILLHLCGRTVLWHTLTRCAAIDGVDLVCCAIPDTNENDPVAEEAARSGAIVTRGSEYDVLDRYLNAANEIAVEAFLGNKIGFLDISKTIEKTLLDVPVSNVDTLARVVENDQLSRQIARSVIESSA